MAQISHAGVLAASDETGIPTVAPSAVLPPVLPSKASDGISLPEELTVEEIYKIEIDFVKAALRAKETGFDGVEIHSAHGYLLSQFYSPLMNMREDQYGRQTIENATRFPVETLKAVRKAVGEDYPISIRLGGVDYIDGGSTVDVCAKACRILASAGADLLDLSGGITGFMRPGHTEAGYFKEMSIAAKKVTDVSVMLTGGVTTVAEAESLLEGNACDLVGVGRAILKNPAWE